MQTPDTARPSDAEFAAGDDLKRIRAAVVLLATVVVPAVLYLAMPLPEPLRAGLGHTFLVIAPLATTAACLRMRHAGSPAARRAWRLFAAGAGVAAVGHLLWPLLTLAPGATGGPSLLRLLSLLLFYILFGAGAVVALQSPHARRSAAEIGLDGALILVSAAVLLPRFLLAPLIEIAQTSRVAFAVVLGGELSALAAFFCAALLLLWRNTALPQRAAAALTAAAAAFVAGTMLLPLGLDPSPGRPGDAFDLIWLTGWGCLTVAALLTADPGERSRHPGSEARVAYRLRQAVAPAAAVFMGAATIDAVLRPSVPLETTLALGALGPLLALRIGHSIRMAERRTHQHRRFVHTQALVELSHALAGSTELDRTLSLVTVWTRRLLQGHAAGIALLTEEDEVLEMRAVCGLSDEVIGMRFPVADTFTGRVVEREEPRVRDSGLDEPLSVPESTAFIGGGAMAAAPLRFRDHPLGALVCLRDRDFDSPDLDMLGALGDQAAIAIENARLFEQVRTLSLTDPLTDLANRRQLEHELRREFAAARRGRALVAILFDLDDFKRYNDDHGHLAGDAVLRAFGRLLATETREMNLAARYGGDEFLVLLSDDDVFGAEVLVERIRRRFAEELGEWNRAVVTVSAGIAEYRPDMDDAEQLIAAADRELYRAKAPRHRRP